jgi:YfiH family protein
MITSQRLSRLRGVTHGFFTRKSGASDGIYASLNCGYGSGDDPARVAENRRRVAGMMGVRPQALVTCHQVHSPTVVIARGPWAAEAAPQADGIVTREPGLALGVLHADCAPILLAEPEAGIIGAVHAGWKGAFGGVLEAGIAAIEELGGQRQTVIAAIGPSIGPESYEVDDAFRARFLQQSEGNVRYFGPGKREGHVQFDLPSYVEARLRQAGVLLIERLALDTCARADLFFSYRRSVLTGEPDYGRNISAIALQTRR